MEKQSDINNFNLYQQKEGKEHRLDLEVYLWEQTKTSQDEHLDVD